MARPARPRCPGRCLGRGVESGAESEARVRERSLARVRNNSIRTVKHWEARAARSSRHGAAYRLSPGTGIRPRRSGERRLVGRTVESGPRRRAPGTGNPPRGRWPVAAFSGKLRSGNDGRIGCRHRREPYGDIEAALRAAARRGPVRLAERAANIPHRRAVRNETCPV
jgi:hypothetical protein